MASKQIGYSKEKIDRIRETLTKRAETDPSINVEERISFIVTHLEQEMDVDWGDTLTLSSFAMSFVDDEVETDK
jgi:hypothetical protein